MVNEHGSYVELKASVLACALPLPGELWVIEKECYRCTVDERRGWVVAVPRYGHLKDASCVNLSSWERMVGLRMFKWKGNS